MERIAREAQERSERARATIAELTKALAATKEEEELRREALRKEFRGGRDTLIEQHEREVETVARAARLKAEEEKASLQSKIEAQEAKSRAKGERASRTKKVFTLTETNSHIQPDRDLRTTHD